MFNFFRSNKKIKPPFSKELRKFFENNLLWLEQEFPIPSIEERRILTPTKEDFPITWNKSEDNAFEALEIICKNMQIDPKAIHLDFYDNGIKEIDMGGSIMFIQSEPGQKDSAGQYHWEKVDGKYHISIDEALLEKPDALISTLAHELAHVKILGEKQLGVDDEMLTDLATVFFGLGIFNANTAFQFTGQHDRWGYNILGYLKIEEWAYALALFAFIRREDDPHWKQYLSPSIKSDFEKSLQYLIENEDEIFRFDEEEE
jgi:hypothetical protein